MPQVLFGETARERSTGRAWLITALSDDKYLRILGTINGAQDGGWRNNVHGSKDWSGPYNTREEAESALLATLA